MDEKKSSSIESMQAQLMDAAINKMVAGMWFIGIVGVSFSVSRALVTGWVQAYSFHLGALAAATLLFLFRHSLTSRIKAWMMLAISFTVAFTGIWEFGIVGNGVLWALFSMFLGLFFLGKRVAFATGGLLFVVLVWSMHQFTSGTKVFPVDFEIYLSNYASWAATFFGSVVFFIFLIAVYFTNLIGTQNLIKLLEKQNLELAKLANFDRLTQLPVFNFFKEQLQTALLQSQREQRFIACGFIDLDDFKIVNDEYGHDAGDQVLKEVAQRLTRCMRSQDQVGRMGGDEFVFFINSATEPDLKSICHRIIHELNQPIPFGDTYLEVGCSIGVAISSGGDESAETLIKRADHEMYQVKRLEKNHFSIAEARMS